MLTQQSIDKLQSADIRALDKNELADMSRITLDNSLSKEARMNRILAMTKNPYCFRYGNTAVKLEFADDGPPLQDVMTGFLIRQKGGL